MTITLIQNTDGTVDVTNGSGPTTTLAVDTTSSVLESFVRAQSLNQMGAPTAALDMNGQAFINASDVGRQIAAHYYEPTSAYIKLTNSNTPAAIDTTNLTVSFTATTTAVMVELTAGGGLFSGTGGYYWGLLVHSSSTQVGYWAMVENGATPILVPCTVRIRVTGLTAGTGYQYDWAHVVSGSTLPTGAMAGQCGTGSPAANSDYGPLMMRVLAA